MFIRVNSNVRSLHVCHCVSFQLQSVQLLWLFIAIFAFQLIVMSINDNGNAKKIISRINLSHNSIAKWLNVIISMAHMPWLLIPLIFLVTETLHSIFRCSQFRCIFFCTFVKRNGPQPFYMKLLFIVDSFECDQKWIHLFQREKKKKKQKNKKR